MRWSQFVLTLIISWVTVKVAGSPLQDEVADLERRDRRGRSTTRKPLAASRSPSPPRAQSVPPRRVAQRPVGGPRRVSQPFPLRVATARRASQSPARRNALTRSATRRPLAGTAARQPRQHAVRSGTQRQRALPLRRASAPGPARQRASRSPVRVRGASTPGRSTSRSPVRSQRSISPAGRSRSRIPVLSQRLASPAGRSASRSPVRRQRSMSPGQAASRTPVRGRSPAAAERPSRIPVRSASRGARNTLCRRSGAGGCTSAATSSSAGPSLAQSRSSSRSSSRSATPPPATPAQSQPQGPFPRPVRPPRKFARVSDIPPVRDYGKASVVQPEQYISSEQFKTSNFRKLAVKKGEVWVGKETFSQYPHDGPKKAKVPSHQQAEHIWEAQQAVRTMKNAGVTRWSEIGTPEAQGVVKNFLRQRLNDRKNLILVDKGINGPKGTAISLAQEGRTVTLDKASADYFEDTRRRGNRNVERTQKRYDRMRERYNADPRHTGNDQLPAFNFLAEHRDTTSRIS